MSRAIEAEGEQWRMLASKGWRHWLQMIEHHAEELLDHFRIPGAIELRESVFGGWSDPAQGPERVRAEAQGIAHVIETEGLSQLGIEQADDLALGTESSGVIFDASATDQFEREVWQDEVAKLTKNGKLSRVGSNNVSFIPYIVTRRSRSSQHFFIPQPSSASDGNENF